MKYRTEKTAENLKDFLTDFIPNNDFRKKLLRFRKILFYPIDIPENWCYNSLVVDFISYSFVRMPISDRVCGHYFCLISVFIFIKTLKSVFFCFCIPII